MKVSEYNEFVRRTDQSKERTPSERKEIALYGLAGEIGRGRAFVFRATLALLVRPRLSRLPRQQPIQCCLGHQ